MALSKGRPRRRQGQRGAAVFIVVMVLTLLTAIGIVAIRATTLADAAAGYDREGAQAALIAQYGVTATTAYMANVRGSAVVNAVINSELQLNPPVCESNWPSATNTSATPHPACFRFLMSDLQSSITQETNDTVFAPSNTSGPAGSTSSLSPSESTNAIFVVELTEGAKTGVPTAGGQTKDTSVMLTMTSIAQVRPAAAVATNACAASQGQQVMRAMITAQQAPSQ